MKTQLQKPSLGKGSYSEEFKRRALEHRKNSGCSAARVAPEKTAGHPLRSAAERYAQIGTYEGAPEGATS